MHITFADQVPQLTLLKKKWGKTGSYIMGSAFEGSLSLEVSLIKIKENARHYFRENQKLAGKWIQ